MTMLANKTETRALTLADYEARIHLYKEQGALAYIGIGRTLTEAKEAGVVPHGQWETWVQEVAGFTPRQAQRCMQMAEKVPEGSAMAKLDASKALLLISSGLDAEEQEEIAGKAVEEGATVKALREQLKQAKLKLVQETGAATEIREELKRAEADRESMAEQMKATEAAYQIRMNDEKEKAYLDGVNMGKQEAKNQLEIMDRARQANLDHANKLNARITELVNKEKVLQNELNKQTQYAADLRKKLEEGPEVPADFAKDREILIAAAEEAEKRAADAEAELEALKAGGAGQPDPIWKTLKLATDRFMADCETMPLDPAALISDQRRIRANVNWIGSWVDMMRKALDAAVPAEGAVE